MFAGRMKLNHFLLIVVGLAAAGIGAYVMLGSDDDPAPQPVASQGIDQPASNQPDNPPEQPEATPVETEGGGGREVDGLVMEWAGKSLGKEKVKDAIKGHGFKVNLYQDKGKDTVTRAKIDLNRDGKWDEKWTFDGSNISRKVAPADDEKYTESYDWNGSEWVAR